MIFGADAGNGYMNIGLKVAESCIAHAGLKLIISLTQPPDTYLCEPGLEPRALCCQATQSHTEPHH